MTDFETFTSSDGEVSVRRKEPEQVAVRAALLALREQVEGLGVFWYRYGPDQVKHIDRAAALRLIDKAIGEERG